MTRKTVSSNVCIPEIAGPISTAELAAQSRLRCNGSRTPNMDRCRQRTPPSASRGKLPAPHMTSISAQLHAVALRRRIGLLARWGMPVILRACTNHALSIRRNQELWGALRHRKLRTWLALRSQRCRPMTCASFKIPTKALRQLTPSSMIPRPCMSPTTGRRTFRSHLTRSMLSKPSSGGRLMRC